MRQTGIPVLGDAPWGTHFCQFYENKQDLIEILVPYFRAGLENNEFCMWITSEPLGVEEAAAALARAMPDLDRYIRDGRIEILDYSEWYTQGGTFDADRVLHGWVEKLEAARDRGLDGLRLTGNTFWLEKSDWLAFTDYEAMVDRVIGRFPMLAICTYALGKCGAAEIMDVVSNHAFALVKRAGRWQIIESAERRKMEAALRESEERLQFATDGAQIGVWSWRPGTNEVVVSGRWRHLFGVGPDAPVTYETWCNAIHPGDRERAIEELNAAALEHREFDTEYRVILPDGTIRWIVDRGRASYDDAGHPKAMAGVNVDVSGTKRAEEALRQQREWLRVTLTSIGDGVLAADAEGRITFLNPVAAALTGWTDTEAAGRPAREVFRTIDEDTGAPAEDIIARVLRDGRVLTLANHTALRSRDGRAIPIEDSAAPIRDAAGNVSGAVLVFHDVTAKRRAEDALREAEQSVRRKLDTILLPEGDIGGLELRDIIDVEAIQSLMDKFHKMAPMPMAIIDLTGKVLVGVGWQDVCTKYHRVNPESCKHCVESDLELSAGVQPGQCRMYKCKNNMWDIATPIVIGGRHVGNIFSGQFFLQGESIDYELFRRQAERYGFNETEYLAALERVPRLPKDFVDTGMAYLTQLGHMLSLLSYSNIKLARSLAERDELMSSLRQVSEQRRLALEAAELGAWDYRFDTGEVFWDERCRNLFGFASGSRTGYTEAISQIHPEDRDATDRAVKLALAGAGGGVYHREFRVIWPDGSIHWVASHGRVYFDGPADQRRATRFVGVNMDVTSRKRLEEQLRQRMEEIQTVMDVAPAAIWVAHDPECNQITGNRMANRVYEAGEGENVSANATPLRRFFRHGRELQPQELPMQEAAARGVEIRDSELEVMLPSGVKINILGQASPLHDSSGRVRGCVGAFVDITDRVQSETRLRHAQKMESLGVLAGGLAHDFNNLLVGVIGNASLAQDMLPEDDPATELLDAVIANGERAAHLTRQMLAYAGKGRFMPEPLNLSELIPEMTGLVQPSIPKRVVLEFDLQPDLPQVEADRGQMQQVFMNLVLNAAEAIGSAAGLIAVRTAVQEVDDLYRIDHPDAAELATGSYVCLEVADTGCGMDAATRARIFDPFFSTKFQGRGLGLAAVAGIVRGQKGTIQVASSAGKGSSFRVLLPAAVAAGAMRTDRAVSAVRHDGRGTILVVDDEEVVREMAEKSLARCGYKVLLASDGAAAVDVCKRSPNEISLVLLDLSMPGMSGEETLPELLKIRPNLKVLISSGYNENETLRLFGQLPVAGFLQKPYTAARLSENVRNALQGG